MAQTPQDASQTTLSKVATVRTEILKHADYIRSAAWRDRAEAMKKRANYKCRVCNHDWKDKGWGPLDAHHPDYSKLGHEGFGDLVPLCRQHHPKGAFSRENIAMWRSSYRWRKRAAWIFRNVWWLMKRLARSKSSRAT